MLQGAIRSHSHHAPSAGSPPSVRRPPARRNASTPHRSRCAETAMSSRLAARKIGARIPLRRAARCDRRAHRGWIGGIAVGQEGRLTRVNSLLLGLLLLPPSPVPTPARTRCWSLSALRLVAATAPTSPEPAAACCSRRRSTSADATPRTRRAAPPHSPPLARRFSIRECRCPVRLPARGDARATAG